MCVCVCVCVCVCLLLCCLLSTGTLLDHWRAPERWMQGSRSTMLILMAAIYWGLIIYQTFSHVFFLWKRKKERSWMSKQREGRQRGRQRLWNRLCTSSAKANVELEPTNCEIMTWAEVRHTTDQAPQAPLCHVGFKLIVIFPTVLQVDYQSNGTEEQTEPETSSDLPKVTQVISDKAGTRLQVRLGCGHSLCVPLQPLGSPSQPKSGLCLLPLVSREPCCLHYYLPLHNKLLQNKAA